MGRESTEPRRQVRRRLAELEPREPLAPSPSRSMPFAPSIVLRGPAPFGPDRPAGPGFIEQVLLLGAAVVAVGAVIALRYRRRRPKSS